MNPMAPIVCLITPGHVTSTPRLVKNADALVEAGYRVHVISGAPFPPADSLDAEVLREAKWEYTRVNTRQGLMVFARKVVRKFARRLVKQTGAAGLGLLARAQFAESVHLARSAARIPAGLFIGHSISALYAAASAARTLGRPFGFDIEDYHDAETSEAIADPVEMRARRSLQSRLLPRCRVLTCASPLIGLAYADSYQVSPETVLNVFPRSMAPSDPPTPANISEDRPAVLYWFSQSVGHGRGLEDIIRVIGKMQTPVELHLRGFVSPEFADHLRSVAAEARLGRPLRFLPPGSPGEMARLASVADMGLSIEEREPPNRDICLTNKIFVYLLAGIPQLLSNTTAQRALAPDLHEAALCGDITRSEETARMLDSFLANRQRVGAARLAAWSLAQTRFCWDIEKETLLRLVRGVLPPPR